MTPLAGTTHWQNGEAQGVWGLSFSAWERDRLQNELARLAEKEAEQAKRRRIICGAKTRKGHPCRMKSEPGKRRCKFHGGLSTGPRTKEGKQRIAEAQRKRWAAHRARCVDYESSKAEENRDTMTGGRKRGAPNITIVAVKDAV
ncbi:MAG: HGGxSTG domain-containing protein [Pseudomonadota bacterium]